MITQEMIRQFAKKFGEEGQAIVGPYIHDRHKVTALSTGSLILDNLTGIGGFPKGRLTEVYGRPGSGKTFTCFSAIAQAQKAGKAALYIDAEIAFYGPFAEAIGVDLSPEKFMLVQTNDGDRAFDIAVEAIKTGEFGIVVFDSVPAMRPHKELEGTMEDNFFSIHPRMMGRGVPLLQIPAVLTGTAIVFINQVRDSMSLYGSPITTPGGWNLKHSLSLRLEMSRTDDIKEGKELIGFEMKAKVVKDKVGNLSRETPKIKCFLTGGFSKEHDLLTIGKENGTIEQRGSWIYMGNEKLGQGEDQVIRLLRNDPTLLSRVQSVVEAPSE